MKLDSTKASQTTKTPQKPPSYKEKTNRIVAWTELIKSFTPYIWLIVICVVLIPLIGRGVINYSLKLPQKNLSQVPKLEIVSLEKKLPKQTEINQQLINSIKAAKTKAKQFASDELDLWISELMKRVDQSFLPWYFDYFNQKKIEFSAPLIWLQSALFHTIDARKNIPNNVVAEKLTANFQTEFTKRVLRPKTAQLHLEKITRETVDVYLGQLANKLNAIQTSYQIPQGEWQRYLDDLAITIYDTEGNVSNLSMKIIAGGSTYLAAKTIIPVATKISTKIAASLAGKTGAKMATKTGGIVAGKLGAQLLDPIVAIGIIAWDLWDYNHTVALEKPVLRDAIAEYLLEIKASLLSKHETSVMSVIEQVENSLIKQLINSKPQPI